MCLPQKKKELCDMIEVLATSTVVVILQFIKVSYQLAVYLKLTRCYMTSISQKHKNKK